MVERSSSAVAIELEGQVAPTRRLTLRQFLAYFTIAVILSLTVMVVLPHDKYLRYQALNDHVFANAYWVYERIHSDPTPIDIAFVGTSRTGRSMNSVRLQQDLAQRGTDLHAANFFMFKNGRNMHYAIAKELLEHRKVGLLLLEITELEDRRPHPDFVFLADPQDIVFAPAVINLRYLSDLARLPGRQVDLFLQTALQNFGLRTPDFVPPPYQGPNLDISEALVSLDGKRHSFALEHPRDHMEALRTQQEASITPPVLPHSLEGLEFRLPRYYIDQILELARKHGTRVAFVYLPRYGGPEAPPPYALYEGRVPLINPAAGVPEDYRLWDDETHVNWAGAQRLTDAVARELVEGHYVPAPQRTATTTSTARTPALE